MFKLSDREITKRLTRLRNLERLYACARERIAKLEEENKQLKIMVVMQATQIETLKLQIEELQIMVSGRKKKSKDTVKDQSMLFGTKKRTPRNRPALSYRRPIPKDSAITEIQHHSLDSCPECTQGLTRIQIVERYIEDILPVSQWHSVRGTVTKHFITTGYCAYCQKRISALPLSKHTTTLGENIKQLVSCMTVISRFSYDQIHEFLEVIIHLSISEGEITNILAKQAMKLLPEYESMKQRIRSQKGAHYDETSWNVQDTEQGNYAWVMTGVETEETIFACGKSRGKGVAEALRGNNTSQPAITDDYGAYRNFSDHHQLCWAHPIRKLRDLSRSDVLSDTTRSHCHDMHRQFVSLCEDVRDTTESSFVSKKREKKKHSLMRRFHTITQPHPCDPMQLTKIKERLRKNKRKYFTCITTRGIPCDNNKAERALRHLVIKRKLCFGSKTQRGADMMSVLYSVLLSLWWKSKRNFFQELSLLLSEGE